MQITRNILLNPGPATTTDAVKYAQVVPDICPREEDFGDLMEGISRDLVRIAGGSDDDHACVLFGGSGTAGMDAVINSVVPPGGKLLVVNNGAYGQRMLEIARAYGITTVDLAYDWTVQAEATDVEAALRRDPDIVCVAIVHHETTTGLLNPVPQVGEVARRNGRTFIVDAISSFAGIPLDVANSGIDFMMSTSNKCIQGMPGVCFVICRRQELDKLKARPKRSYYLDLYGQYDFFLRKHQTQFTPPVQTLYALRRAIDEFLEEGAEARYRRYRRNWETLRAGMADMGFRMLTRPEQEANLLITILYPEDPSFDFDTMHDRLREKGYTIYPGKVGGADSFRLAVLGAIDREDITGFLAELGHTLREMGVDMEKLRRSAALNSA